MNKTAIKNFAIWARNKLIADISYRAGLMGITADGIHSALPQSTGQTEFYDIGTSEPYAITGEAITQRRHLVELIRAKEKDTNYKTAYKYVIEEVAYTWFNRLIAVRFMEVNDYLPSHIRVLSSQTGKLEPDLVTTPFDADLEFSRDEQQRIIDLKNENKVDDLFRMLFIKQCNALNEILPALFEKTDDYTELLLNLSVIDQDGVVYHLVHDIPEEDFDIERGGQVEIIGWLYQYYNTEPKNAAFAKKGKITKEEIPAVTQLFTPDWIVRYMVENSVGRIWIEHLRALDESADEAVLAADFGWKYYLPEAKQEPEVEEKLRELRKERASLTPDQITMIDPCMGSGHILVYGFSVLMQIYESAGYSQREAAKSILEHNLFGLDIDDRAYQMAYFAVMMKAREYNRRILNGENSCKVYAIQESNGIGNAALCDMGANLSDADRKKALKEIRALITEFKDAKEYGSILNIDKRDWNLLRRFAVSNVELGQLSLDMNGAKEATERLQEIIDIAEVITNKFWVTITNPPYMGSSGMDYKLVDYVKDNYPISKSDMSTVFMERCMSLCMYSGYMSMINIPVWMFLSSYEKLRYKLMSSCTYINMVHSGRGIFGSDFGTTTFVLKKGYTKEYTGSYRRLFDVQGEVKTPEVRKQQFLNGKGNFIARQDNFSRIPGMTIAYWVSDALLEDFSYQKASSVGRQCLGMRTGDNERFLRLWYEVSLLRMNISCHSKSDAIASKDKWFPYNKGGEFRKWYGNLWYVVNWESNGKEIKDYVREVYPQLGDNLGWKISNEDKYFCKGIAWSRISSSFFGVRICDDNLIFDTNAPMMFANDDYMLEYYAGILTSKVATTILTVINPTISFQVGDIAQIPIIVKQECVEFITDMVDECVSISRTDWDSFETSWNFQIHPMVPICAGDLDCNYFVESFYQRWANQCEGRFKTLKNYEEELNRFFINIYGLQDELTPEIEDKDVTIRKADLQRDIKSLLSYAVGCMFGRYSLDFSGIAYAGGTWNTKKYSSFIPDADNIIPITDEEYLEDDIVSRFCAWLKVVYGESSLEENLDFIAKALGNKGNSSREIIRNYFLNDFFKDHCQTYSVTGSGKRPIYWLFDSGKQNGFKALIYLHRYTLDTIGNLRIDYLHRMQRIYESEINRMQDMIDHSTNTREVAQATKRKEKLTKQLKECREYDEKLAHLALSRIELDLDDGVKVNYRKIQTASDGKFYEVLADSKNIMTKK